MDEDYGGREGKARAPEDTVLYSIFPDFALTESISSEQIESKLKELQVNCLDIVSPFVKDYIWQHDSFNLKPSDTNSSCLCTSSSEDSNSSPLVPHLHGKLKYGDNVDDEWFVVFLLYEITRKIPYVSARAWDTDGEFLLIEAAYAIPRWIKPENSANRVFIRHGELHILPLPASPAEIYRLPVKPSVPDSLRVLAGGSVETRASDAVQDILNARVGSFPVRAVQNMHRVRVRVPVRVAQVLKHEPQLISKAVEGFYDRDVDSMKAAAKMEKFLGDKEMVDVCVKMSRAMYAQLVQQVFQAPRCYPMPHLSSPNYREAELGMKISCGFEMIYHERSQYQEDVEPGVVGFSDAAAKSSKLKAAQNKDIGWEAFRKSLENKGYFRGLLEGSNEYQRLMSDALDYYRSTSLFSRTSMVMHKPVRCINETLALPHSSADFIGLELPPSDDDSWLYNGEEDLNAALFERQKEMDLYEEERCRYKQSKKPKEDSTSRKMIDDFNLEDIAKNMHAFVENMSSYEGAELPRNANSETVSLDMRQFLKELKSAVGANTENKCVSTQENYAVDSGCSSSDMDFDENESDTGESIGLEETDEQLSMTKDNDGSSDTFMNEYSDALKEQLNNSTLAKSFVHPEDSSKLGDKNKVETDVQRNLDDELMPVDVDFNLVQSLLNSFSSQQGMPGPASNLLGLMGLQLPDDSKTG